MAASMLKVRDSEVDVADHSGSETDGFRQTPEQAEVVKPEAGEARPEPKSPQDWADRGADPSGDDPPTRGGSSQGQGDKTPSLAVAFGLGLMSGMGG